MDADLLVIGGGVVGLACVREAARHGLNSILIEQHSSFGQETSSRNSEVIHSGIYYPTGSLKAKLCVAASRNLYTECDRLGVWYRNCSKLVVAVDREDETELMKIHQRGIANGVEGLQLLTAAEAKKIEPHIECHSAMLVPSTGIIDSHELMKAYLIEARSFGAEIVFNVKFVSAEVLSPGYRIRVRDAGGEESFLSVAKVINAAGLSADCVAAKFGIDIDAVGYRLYPSRGHYYRVSSTKSKLVNRLIYPVPLPSLTHLGIHITLDRAGQMRLGPDAEYVDPSSPIDEWYKFDESRMERFYTTVARYFPSLERTDLSPDQIGVRAKLQKPGEGIRDFIIREESEKGSPGLVNLIGIESPGLTCSHEIAREALRLSKAQ